MIKQTALVALLGLSLFSARPAEAGVPPDGNHSHACFFNTYKDWDLYIGCVYIGENRPSATLSTANGTYYVTCSMQGGCAFTWKPNRPGPGYPEEP